MPQGFGPEALYPCVEVETSSLAFRKQVAAQTMRLIIQDKFTSLPVSRQRKWQLRKEALGLCPLCGRVKPKGYSWCADHAVKVREDQRIKQGAKKRYKNARSYKLPAPL